VRQNFGRLRLCYEAGLRDGSSIQGRVTVRFVIGRDGMVSSASSLAGDSLEIDCVVRAFYGLIFPKPDGGAVTVTYPVHFAPGG
jgi:hypothetical protein